VALQFLGVARDRCLLLAPVSGLVAAFAGPLAAVA
jgi:hypothetical protein